MNRRTGGCGGVGAVEVCGVVVGGGSFLRGRNVAGLHSVCVVIKGMVRWRVLRANGWV